MSQSFDPRALNAFFQEVNDSHHIELKYDEENEAFPIQLTSNEGLSRDKTHQLLSFIKTQIDLRDNEICKIHLISKSTKVIIEISKKAAHDLAQIYALSLFFDLPDEDEPI